MMVKRLKPRQNRHALKFSLGFLDPHVSNGGSASQERWQVSLLDHKFRETTMDLQS